MKHLEVTKRLGRVGTAKTANNATRVVSAAPRPPCGDNNSNHVGNTARPAKRDVWAMSYPTLGGQGLGMGTRGEEEQTRLKRR